MKRAGRKAPMHQEPLFDLATGEAAWQRAAVSWEQRFPKYLERAREVGVGIARAKGRVTADDILAVIGLPDQIHHNVIGGIFQDRRFRLVDYTKTARPEGHSRRIGVWGLRDVDGHP